MRPILAVLLSVVCACAAARTPPTPSASGAGTPATPITTLQAVTVTGVMPGPGLWKVTRGDHVLWILGVVPMLPAGMKWQSAEVADTIAASQVVIEPPGVKLKLDTNWFGKLLMLPSVYRAKHNPDDQTLADVLPPDLYARWQIERAKYLPDDHGVERERPLLAAGQLLKQGLRANHLRRSGEIVDRVKALADAHHVKLVKPQAVLEIRKPREAVEYLAAQEPQGIACLRAVVDVLEGGLPNYRARANAWATGDIEALKRVPEGSYRTACEASITGATFAEALGISDLPARIEGHWLADADAALAAHPQSFAVLPMHELLAPNGYLAALRTRGYGIVAPDAGVPEDPASSSNGAPVSSTNTPLPAPASTRR